MITALGEFAQRIYVDRYWAELIEHGIVDNKWPERYWELSGLIRGGVARQNIIAREFDDTMENVGGMMRSMCKVRAKGGRGDVKKETDIMYKYFSRREGVLR
jgi:hypothetical protein